MTKNLPATIRREQPLDDDAAMAAFGRLVLQARAIVDVPHSKLKHLRIVGFIIEPDEHYRRNDGVTMIRALQTLADVDVTRSRDAIEDRLDTTDFDCMSYGGLHG